MSSYTILKKNGPRIEGTGILSWQDHKNVLQILYEDNGDECELVVPLKDVEAFFVRTNPLEYVDEGEQGSEYLQ